MGKKKTQNPALLPYVLSICTYSGLTPRKPPRSGNKSSDVHVPSLFHRAGGTHDQAHAQTCPPPTNPPAGAGFVPPARPTGGGVWSSGFPSCRTALSNGHLLLSWALRQKWPHRDVTHI